MGYMDEGIIPSKYQKPGGSTYDEQQAEADKALGYAPGSREAAEIGNYQRVGDQGAVFNNPGSADFGGFNGGAEVYSQNAKDQMSNNADLVGSNNTALAGSLANMRGNRGPVAQENTDLTGRENDARNQQYDALQLAGDAAAGNAPSEAAIQTRGAMGGLMGSRASAMGGARGLGALTGSQGGAAIGGAAGSLAAQGGQNRSQEIGNAMGVYGGMAGQMRGQDLSRLDQNSKNSMFNANLNDSWKVGNANLAVAQGGLGNSLSGTNADWYKQSMMPTETQFAHDQQAQGWQNGAYVDDAALRAEKDRQLNKTANQGAENLASGTMSAISMGAQSGMGGSKKKGDS